MRAVNVLGMKPQVLTARELQCEMIVLQVVAAHVYLMPRSGRVFRRHVRICASAACAALARLLGEAPRARVAQRFQLLLHRFQVFDIVGHVDQGGYALKIGDIPFSRPSVGRHRFDRSLCPGVPRKQGLSVGRCRHGRVHLDFDFGHVGVVVVHRPDAIHS